MRITCSLAALGIVSAFTTGTVAADPVWDRIQTSGNLTCGAIPNDPVGSWQDRQTGRWEGYEVELCRTMARDLSQAMGREITPVFRETSWKTIVLDLQSNKIDIWPGMAATPERQKALTMVGPIYGLAYCVVTNEGFQFDGTWNALNDPKVRIATVTGTSTETAFKELAPKATHITLTENTEINLAVQSGRADLLGNDVLRCINVSQSGGTVFGAVVFPTPIQGSKSSAGVIKAADRLAAWLEQWVKEKQAAGEIRTLFFNVLALAGFDTSSLPHELEF